MQSLNPLYIVPVAVLLITLLVVARLRRVARAAARARQRVVEKPNSHYEVKQVVRERVIVNPWKHLVLDHVHEINRVEVQRLLAVVEAVGADALTPSERTFLDQFRTASTA